MHSVVCDHVVQGRVIFPGAGYLEMARAATGAELQGVFFLQPLVVEASGPPIDCVVSDGRFDIRSNGDDASQDATAHCSGNFVPRSWDQQVELAR